MKIILIASNLILFCSCNIYYLPNTRSIPMFEKKKELQTSASVIGGLNFQSAYSLPNHLGIIANGLYYSSQTNTSSALINYYEGGLGYYSNNSQTNFAVFGGYGVGKMDVNNSNNNFYYNDPAHGQYQKFFIQPGYSFKEKNFWYGAVLRISYVDFSNLTSYDTGQPLSLTNNRIVFFEPAAMCRFNYKKIFATAQGGVNYQAFGIDGKIGYLPFQYAIGVGLKLNFDKVK